MVILPVAAVYYLYSQFGTQDFYDDLADVILVTVGLELVVLITFLRIGQIERLKESGQRIEAQVVGVQEVVDEEKKDKDYKIVAKYVSPATGQEYVYTSETMEYNPQNFLPAKVTVYIDPHDPNKYYLDTDFLNSVEPDDDEYKQKTGQQ